MLSKKAILAIEQVLTVNKDIVELCENRGVMYDDLKEIFKLACNSKEQEENSEFNKSMVNMLKKAECREHGGMGGMEHFGETCWPCTIRGMLFMHEKASEDS